MGWLALALLAGLLMGCGSTKSAETAPATTAPESPQSTEASSTAATNAATDAADATPVSAHGRLHVAGTSLVDESGAPFGIRGISTHGLAWYPQYVSDVSFATWRDWGANTVRLALYTQESGGWCSGGDRSALEKTLFDGIDAATAEGMYVIVDWHILSDNNPLTHLDEAESFFSAVTARYPNQTNIIYEICNEPNGGTSWNDVYDYATQVIPVVRASSPDAVVVVGTPTWCQDVDQVSSKPLHYDNVLYSLHFYAGTHREGLRAKAAAAIASGTPLLVSEFGICDASGNGSCDEASANEWISFLDSNGIGYVCWNLSNKNESSALISSTCTKSSAWDSGDLSQEGRWYVGILSGSTPKTSSTPVSGAASASAATSGTVSSTENRGEADISCAVDATWASGSEQFAKCTLTLSNTTAKAIAGWKATVTFSNDVAVDQIWGASSTVSANAIELTPLDYASQVAAGATQTGQVGFIVRGSTVPTIVSATLSI